MTPASIGTLFIHEGSQTRELQLESIKTEPANSGITKVFAFADGQLQEINLHHNSLSVIEAFKPNDELHIVHDVQNDTYDLAA